MTADTSRAWKRGTRVGVISSCELPIVGAQNRTQDVCKSGACFVCLFVCFVCETGSLYKAPTLLEFTSTVEQYMVLTTEQSPDPDLQFDWI